MIVWIAVTGALMVFRPQLTPLVNRDLLVVAPCTSRLPLDQLTEAALAAQPSGKLDYIRIFGADDASAMVRFAGQNQATVYLNPCTGTVLGEQDRFGGLFGRLEQLHRFRFIKSGNLITGTSALIFASILIAGGLLLWLPASLRAMKSAVKFNPYLTGRARALNRHRTIGFYASLIVLTSALTGLPQAFDWYKNAMYGVTGSPLPGPAPKSAGSPVTPRLPMEKFWQHAQSLVPHPREALLHYPRAPDDPVEIYLISRDAPHPNARTYLFLDQYKDEVLSYTPYSQSSLGHKLYFWTLSIHTGETGGILLQLILLAGAASVPVLAYTGISAYVRRNFPATRTSSGRARAPATPVAASALTTPPDVSAV